MTVEQLKFKTNKPRINLRHHKVARLCPSKNVLGFLKATDTLLGAHIFGYTDKNWNGSTQKSARLVQ